MLYDDYSKKMDKLAVFITKLIKLRFMFLAIFIFILAIVSTLLGVKGIITSDLVCKSEIIYGEDLECSSSALMSSVYYEYKEKDGDTWTTQQPILPGEYEVRAVSNRIFNLKSYSNTMSFIIDKKEINITIKDSNIDFGTDPTLECDLVKGDYIKSVDYSYDPNNTLSSTVSITNIIIYNENNEDVTSGYDINTSSKSINLNKVDFYITTSSKEKVYDATPLYSHSYTIDEKYSSNYDIEIDDSAYLSSITNVGTIKNEIDLTYINIIDSDGTNFNDVFNKKVSYGTLTIIKRPITIVSNSNTFTYDGTYHNDLSYSVKESTLEDYGLVNGHHIEVVESSSTSVINVGTYDNELVYKIYDSDGNDVTSNYEIETICGTIIVNQINITVTSNLSRSYNGSLVLASEITFTTNSLCENDSCSLKMADNIINVGTYNAGVNAEIYNNKYGLYVTSSYKITYITSIIITKYELELDLTITKSYDDSKIFTNSNSTVSDYSLFNNDKIIFSVNSSNSVVDTYSSSSFDSFSVYSNNDIDNTSNYSLKSVSLTLIIKERNITLDVIGSKIYDGLDFSINDISIDSYNNTNLIDGHKINYNINSSMILATTYDSGVSATIEKNNEDITSNYNISYNISLVINKRDITFSVVGSKEYDGTKLEDFDCSIKDGSLVLSQTYEITPNYTFIEAFEYTNSSYFDVKIYSSDLDKTEMTTNYNIYLDVSINISRRDISLNVTAVEKTYDAINLDSDLLIYEDINGKLLVENIVSLTNVGEIINAGTYTDTSLISIDIINSSGISVLNNYNITYNVNIIISQFEIDLELSCRKVYDGDTKFTQDNMFTSISLVSNDFIEFEAITSSANVGLYDITDLSSVINYVVYTESGVDNTLNYTLNSVNISATINKRPISLTSNSSTHIYDDTAYYDENYTIDSSDLVEYGLVTGHSIEVISHTEITNVGSIENVLEYKIIIPYLSSTNQDATSNYEINMTSGTLTVEKRNVYLEIFNSTKYYDGTNLDSSYLKYKEIYEDVLYSQILDNKTYYSLISTHSVVLTNVGVIINADTYTDTSLIDIDIKNSDGESVYTNYDITYTVLIEILPFEINLISTSEKVYDATGSFSKTEIITSSNLVNDDYIEYEISKTNAETYNIIDLDDILSWKVYKADGTDNSSNYTLNSVNISATINKRPISLTSNSSTHIYDDTAYYDEKYTIDSSEKEEYGLVSNHYIFVTNHTEIINVGNIENVLEYAIIDVTSSNLENDFTSNYEINMTSGMLTVEKRCVNLEIYNSTKYYDGTNLTNDYLTFSYSEESNYKVVSSHSVVLTNIGEIIDAGIYTNTSLISIDIQNSEFESVATNYDITYTVSIEILQYEIRLVLSGSIVYDKTTLFTQDDMDLSDFELASNDYIEFEVNAPANDAGEYEITDVDAILWKVYKKDESDNSSNYTISKVSLTLIIKQRPITLISNTNSWVYDGESHYDNGYSIKETTVEEYGLLDGDSIEVASYTTITYYSTDEIENILDYKFYDSDSIDITSNYEIDVVYGTLEITPRSITIILSGSLTYDGENLSNDDLLSCLIYSQDSEYELVENDDFKFTTDIINASNYTDSSLVSISINRIIGESNLDTDVTNCYNIVIQEFNITIEKYEIILEDILGEKTYDGTTLFTNSNITSTLPILFGSDTLELNIETSNYIAESYIIEELDDSYWDVKNSSDESGKDNYVISDCLITLTINKKSIIITQYNESEYDQNTHSFNNDDYETNDLIVNDNIYNIEYENNEFIKVNKYETNIISLTIINNNGVDVTSSYELDLEQSIATYLIYFDITLKLTNNGSFIYNSLAITEDDLIISEVDTNKLELYSFEVNMTKFNYDFINAKTYTSDDLLTDEAYQDYFEFSIEYSDGEALPSDIDITKIKCILDITIDKRETNFKVISTNENVEDNSIISKYYDGTKIEITSDNISSENLVSTHTFNIISYTELIYYTDEEVSTNVVIEILDENDEPVSDNYIINYTQAKLVIDKINVNIVVEDSEITYGDNLTELLQIDYSSEVIQIDNALEFELVYDYASSNLFTFAVLEEYIISTSVNETDLEMIRNSYNISYELGSIIINKFDYEVVFSSTHKYYDGTIYTKTKDATIQDDYIKYVVSTTDSVIGTYSYDEETIVVSEIIRRNSDDLDVTSYYNISYDIGNIEIKAKVDLTISIKEAIKTYDGTATYITDCYSFSDLDETSGDTIKKVLTVNNSTKVTTATNCGTYECKLGFIIYNSNDDEIENKYNFIIEISTVDISGVIIDTREGTYTNSKGYFYISFEYTIIERCIIITSESYEVEVDPYYGNTTTVTSSQKVTNLVSGHTVTITKYTVSNGENTFLTSNVKITDSSGKDVTKNYSIIAKFGTVTYIE